MAHIREAHNTDIIWNAPAPDQAANIGDLSDVLDFLAALLTKLLDGQKRSWLSRLLEIGGLADDIFSAMNGIENVLPALLSLTNEQRTELVRQYAERFDLPNDRAEAIVEHLLNIVLEGFQVFTLATAKP